MEKKELIEQLTAAKTLTSTVDIDRMIEMIKQLEQPTTITAELGSEIVSRIERCLDYNSDDFIDKDSAEFELSYDNRIELNRVDVNVYDIMEHITEIIDSYVTLEEEEVEEVDGFIEAQKEAEQAQNINQGLGLEPGGNPYAE